MGNSGIGAGNGVEIPVTTADIDHAAHHHRNVGDGATKEQLPAKITGGRIEGIEVTPGAADVDHSVRNRWIEKSVVAHLRAPTHGSVIGVYRRDLAVRT